MGEITRIINNLHYALHFFAFVQCANKEAFFAMSYNQTFDSEFLLTTSNNKRVLPITLIAIGLENYLKF